MPLPDPLSQVLLALAAVLATGALLGRLLRYLGQPPVIAEILAGIALGPSLLGQKFSGALLPQSAIPMLSILAQVGVVLYLFTVGQELQVEQLQQRKKTWLAVTIGSLLVPGVLGAVLAPGYSPLPERRARRGALPDSWR